MGNGGASKGACLGATTSFDACYAAHRDEAVRLAYLLTGDRQRAEDTVSEIFLRMYRRWDDGEIANPRAYIRRAVTNEVASSHRRLARERAYLTRTRWTSFCEADEAIIERDALGRLLAALPVRQRTAVALRYLDDLPEVEVARRMGTSVGTVKSNAARGLAALRVRQGTGSPREGDGLGA